MGWSSGWVGEWIGGGWRKEASTPSETFVEVVAPTTITDAASAEFDLPAAQEQVNVVFDGIPATDAVNLIIELYSGGAWQAANYAEHVAIPGSISSTYAARIDTVGNICYNAGSAAGESCSVTLQITNHANSLYPIIQVDGGYADLGGTIRRASGAITWKNTAAATKARLRFSAGNIESGQYGVWASPYGAFLPLTAGTPVTLSGDASIALAMSDNPLYCAAVGAYVPGTDDTELRATLNADTSASYEWHQDRSRSDSATYTAQGATAQNYPFFRCGSGAGESMSYYALLSSPDDAAQVSPVLFHAPSHDKDGLATKNVMAGYWDMTDAITSMEISASAGTLGSGTIRMRELALFEALQVGESFGPWTLKSITTASAAANVDFTLGTGLRDVIIGVDVTFSSNNIPIYSRIGTAGGIKSASYEMHSAYPSSGSGSYISFGAAASVCHLTQNCANAATGRGMYVYSIPNLADTYRVCTVEGSYVDSSSKAKSWGAAGAYKGSTAALTTFQALVLGPTMSGTYYHFSLGE